MGRPKKRPEPVLQVPVSYAGISIGDETARLGLSISRGNLDVDRADKILCCRRLKARITCSQNGSHPDQEPLPGMDSGDYKVESVCDVKGFSATGKAIAIGLTFNLSILDLPTLCHFAKREGTLIIDASEELEDGQEEEGAEDGEES